MDRKIHWVEADLIEYVGVHESLRLDFKQSVLMNEPDSKIAEIVSKEISAFANTEGGVIIIGIKERREGKGRVADGLDDGVDPNRMSAEQFQQLVEGNVSPYVRGIRFHRVKLSAERVGRIAIVIDIPPGTTAYQAKDKRYYGRSEYESVPLADHDIRMLMMRGKAVSAAVGITKCSIRTNAQIWQQRLEQYENRKLLEEQRLLPLSQATKEVEKPAKPTFDEWMFQLTITNTGETTIRDFLLVAQVETHLRLHSFGRSIERVEKFRFQVGGLKGGQVFPEAKIFPGETEDFPSTPWTLEVPVGSDLDTVPDIAWTIYLDDSPPSFGVISLRDAFPKG